MALTEQEKRRTRWRDEAIVLAILYLLGAFYSLHWGAVISDPAYDFQLIDSDRLIGDINRHVAAQPFFIPQKSQLKPFLIFSFGCMIGFVYYFTVRRKFMFGKEHGTAHWSNKKEINWLADNKNWQNNLLYTETSKLSLDTRRTGINLNTLVVGGSGSGKTRYFVKPNIMQCNTSFVVTDPKGEILDATGKLLEKAGYTVKVLNLIDMAHSHNYNPFKYVEKETDILKLINCLIKNTTPSNANISDPFWEKAEIAFLQAIFFFLWYECKNEEKNFDGVLRLMRAGKISEDEDYESDLDIMFKKLEKEKPDNIAVKQYGIFKQAPAKTAQSIIISAGVRLAVFNVQEIADLTCVDTLELSALGSRKTALFLLLSDSDKTFHFIAAMLYTQLLDILYRVADKNEDKRLDIHVTLMLDEFANIGEIPMFDEYISTMRSREISSKIILQNLAQLKAKYKDSWETIVGNCDAKLYLGGDEQSTTKYFSENLGKETIDTRNYNRTRGRSSSGSLNYGIQGRELMTPDELGHMPNKDCILMIKGIYPYYSKKYNLKAHRNYKFTGDMFSHCKFDVKTLKSQTLEYLAIQDQESANQPEINFGEIEILASNIEQIRHVIESASSKTEPALEYKIF